MILVLLGTNPYPFSRLLNAMAGYAQETGKQVVAQSGHTPPRAPVECHPFVEHSTLMQWIVSAEVVVSQGGYGGLIDCISVGARTVAVPRRMDLGECMDDQKDLVVALAEENLVVPVYDVAEIAAAIERAKIMDTKSSGVSQLPLHIAQTIQSMLAGVR